MKAEQKYGQLVGFDTEEGTVDLLLSPNVTTYKVAAAALELDISAWLAILDHRVRVIMVDNEVHDLKDIGYA